MTIWLLHMTTLHLNTSGHVENIGLLFWQKRRCNVRMACGLRKKHLHTS